MRVLLLGGGMIAHDQVLPSLYQLQRRSRIGDIAVCARHESTLDALRANATIQRAFPGASFVDAPGDYRARIAALAPHNLVVVGLPDTLHYEAAMAALHQDQHVLCVKPLVLTARESREIERTARERGLLVGIEYHKRFDDRSLMARARYREGRFGDFRLGHAKLLEKWYYRHSNFQQWFTCDATDAFTYIGCHYVDLVHFITGLMPVEVSVYGVRDRFPNGNEGWLWSDARIVWNNGACLNVQNALGFADAAPGTNTQGLTMYCATADGGAWIDHSDQYRGIAHSYAARGDNAGATQYAEPSSDYFQYVDVGGEGLTCVGYGYRSIEWIVERALDLQGKSLEERRALLKHWDESGPMATPANSRYNELVIEAARLSIEAGGRAYAIEYGDEERVVAV